MIWATFGPVILGNRLPGMDGWNGLPQGATVYTHF